MVYDPVQHESDHSRRLRLHELQSEILIMQQNSRKKKRRLEAVLLELKHLRNEEKRLHLDIKARAEEESKLERETTFLDAEIRGIQKKINLLS